MKNGGGRGDVDLVNSLGVRLQWSLFGFVKNGREQTANSMSGTFVRRDKNKSY